MSDVSFYPPAPVAGSNAFGSFEFGVSPFGDISKFNWLDTVISQYANSQIILAMLQNWNDDLDQTNDYENFYDFIWNVLTAQGYGLDIWGVIVGVTRNIEVTDTSWFGFVQGEPGTDSWGPGGSSPWYTGEPVTSTFALTDQSYLTLILAKAAVNICSGSIPSINAVLLRLFGPGNPFGPGGECYLTNGMDMSMAYTFNFQPSPTQLSIIFNSGILPTPGGVASSIVINP